MLFAFNVDRYRTLFSNSIGVNVQDNTTPEGRQITTFNFNENINVDIVDGVANINSISGGDQLNEAQRTFINLIAREPITLVAQQGGFDLGVFPNPIDTSSAGPDTDLARLNQLDTTEFLSGIVGGSGFVYLLFQRNNEPGEGWVLIRTNADRSTAEFLGSLADNFTEIEIVGAFIRLFMSNNRISYREGDVIAVYTITGGENIVISPTDSLNITGGIPDDSITEEQLAFDVTTVWQACTLSEQGAATVATLPDGGTVADFFDINVLWNSGIALPQDGSNGNNNRTVSATSSLLPLISGAVPAGREMLISAMGRGADQFSVTVDGVDTSSTTLTINLINLNSASVPDEFVITHVWVR